MRQGLSTVFRSTKQKAIRWAPPVTVKLSGRPSSLSTGRPSPRSVLAVANESSKTLIEQCLNAPDPVQPMALGMPGQQVMLPIDGSVDPNDPNQQQYAEQYADGSYAEGQHPDADQLLAMQQARSKRRLPDEFFFSSCKAKKLLASSSLSGKKKVNQAGLHSPRAPRQNFTAGKSPDLEKPVKNLPESKPKNRDNHRKLSTSSAVSTSKSNAAAHRAF